MSISKEKKGYLVGAGVVLILMAVPVTRELFDSIMDKLKRNASGRNS